VDVVGVPLNFQNGLPVSGMIYGVYGAIVLAGLWQWIVKARSQSVPADSDVAAPAIDPREKVAA